MLRTSGVVHTLLLGCLVFEGSFAGKYLQLTVNGESVTVLCDREYAEISFSKSCATYIRFADCVWLQKPPPPVEMRVGKVRCTLVRFPRAVDADVAGRLGLYQLLARCQHEGKEDLCT